MSVKKIAAWAFVILVAYYAFTQPHAAAGLLHGVLGMLQSGGQGLANSLSHL
jgi:hypothetical protein